LETNLINLGVVVGLLVYFGARLRFPVFLGGPKEAAINILLAGQLGEKNQILRSFIKRFFWGLAQ
jgi:hypothetical protein